MVSGPRVSWVHSNLTHKLVLHCNASISRASMYAHFPSLISFCQAMGKWTNGSKPRGRGGRSYKASALSSKASRGNSQPLTTEDAQDVQSADSGVAKLSVRRRRSERLSSEPTDGAASTRAVASSSASWGRARRARDKAAEEVGHVTRLLYHAICATQQIICSFPRNVCTSMSLRGVAYNAVAFLDFSPPAVALYHLHRLLRTAVGHGVFKDVSWPSSVVDPE